MTAPRTTLSATATAFHVEAYEKIDYSLVYVDGAFAVENTEIADRYRRFGRCLMVVDETVHGLYRAQIDEYFTHHGIALTVFPVAIRETDKTLRTVERIVDAGDVDEPKPDPAAYLFALQRLGEQPGDCVSVEDNVGGAQAAVAAGIRCVAFPNENTAAHDFPTAQRVDRLDLDALLRSGE